MRMVTVLLFLVAGCGVLSSGAGAPTNAPSSGLGPIAPWSDDTGLSWTAPFILADPALTLAHPSVLVDGPAMDLWVEIVQGDKRRIGHARAESFDAGFGSTTDEAIPTQPWHAGGVGSPAVVPEDDGRTYVFYLSDGKLGLYARQDDLIVARSTPIADDEPVEAVAAGRDDENVHLVILVDGALDELVFPRGDLPGLLDGAAFQAAHSSTGLSLPSWAIAYLDVGQRLQRTPAGRWRQDLFMAASLPSVADLGDQPSPSAIGAASRYLGDDASSFEAVPAPILTGTPYPKSATAAGYLGGVVVLYSARSGPRDAIGVGRQP